MSPPPPAPPSLLIIDDEPIILETTRWAFETIGFQVYTAASGQEGLRCFRAAHPQILLIDFKLPGMTGGEFLRAAKAIDPSILAIMITGLSHQTELIETECQELGAFAFLRKPLRTEEVLQTVQEALKSKSRGGSS